MAIISNSIVLISPAITSQPQSCTNAQYSTAAFSVSASGSAPLAYQWKRNASNIAGATASTLTLTNLALSAAGTYSVGITN